MTARLLLLSLAGGSLSGLLYMALLAGSLGGVLFAYLAQLPLFLVGLGLGLAASLVGAAAATLLVVAAAGWLSGGLFLATGALPVCVLVRQALLNRPTPAGGREWYPPGLLVAWLGGLSATGLLIAALVLAAQPLGIEETVRTALADMLSPRLPAESAPSEHAARLAAQLSGIFPGAVAVSWAVMLAVNGSLAQGLLTGVGRNLRPTPEIAAIVLPSWLFAALGGAVVIAVAAGGGVGYIAANLAIVFVVPFFFQGLGVVHALANRLKSRTLALFVFYLLLILWGVPVILVTIAGIIEPLARIRARFGRPRGPEEE